MPADPTRHSMRDSLGIAAIGGLAVLCCAGPALLAAGALGVLGSWLLNPWLIGAAVLLALGAVGVRLRHRATTPGGADGELCRQPAPDAGRLSPRPPPAHAQTSTPPTALNRRTPDVVPPVPTPPPNPPVTDRQELSGV